MPSDEESSKIDYFIKLQALRQFLYSNNIQKCVLLLFRLWGGGDIIGLNPSVTRGSRPCLKTVPKNILH